METGKTRKTKQQQKKTPRFFGNGINGNTVSQRLLHRWFRNAPRFFGNGINGNHSACVSKTREFRLPVSSETELMETSLPYLKAIEAFSPRFFGNGINGN